MNSEEFDALSVEQKRVLLAQDALELLRTEKIITLPGYYLKIPAGGFLQSPPDRKLKELVAASPCHVCALGALFVSYLKYRNGLTVGEARTNSYERDFNIDAKILAKRLLDIFEPEQLLLIERAFEGTSPLADHVGWERDLIQKVRETEEWEKAKQFWERWRGTADDTEGCENEEPKVAPYGLLFLILTNIIKNNGTFHPEKE